MGGTDSTYTSVAPKTGTYGATKGGDKGDAGTAYYFGKTKNTHSYSNEQPYTIIGELIDGSEGYFDGSGGNNGWGGLNLNRYYINHSNFEKLNHTLNAYNNAGIGYNIQVANSVRIGVQMRMVKANDENRRVSLDGYILNVDVPKNRVWINGELIEGIHSNDLIYYNVKDAYLNALTSIISSVNSHLEVEMFILSGILSSDCT